MTQKYRFIKIEHGHKWYAESPRGAVAGLKRQHALLFTEDNYQEWGKAGGWTMEPLGEDEALPAAKPGGAGSASKHPQGWAVPLPGLED